MSAQLPAQTIDPTTVEQVLVHGDLSKLTPAQRLSYYRAVCESLGLNPLTRPFEYLVLNGRLVLYAKREATEQLRASRNVSITIVSREHLPDAGVYVVTARATLPDGRTDESTGVVSISGLKGEALANALMKAETKAKRRVTLSICGLGWLDESEVADIPEARRVTVDEHGEIVQDQPQPQELPAPAHAAEPVTDAQRRAIWARWKELAKEAGIHEDMIRLLVKARYGVEHSRELTRSQASELLDWLRQASPEDVAEAVGRSVDDVLDAEQVSP
jgi:hypothetical protein